MIRRQDQRAEPEDQATQRQEQDRQGNVAPRVAAQRRQEIQVLKQNPAHCEKEAVGEQRGRLGNEREGCRNHAHGCREQRQSRQTRKPDWPPCRTHQGAKPRGSPGSRQFVSLPAHATIGTARR